MSQKCTIQNWILERENVVGKLENVRTEMRKNGLNVLGLSEVRWKREKE